MKANPNCTVKVPRRLYVPVRINLQASANCKLNIERFGMDVRTLFACTFFFSTRMFQIDEPVEKAHRQRYGTTIL
jgi:hypothetical protein